MKLSFLLIILFLLAAGYFSYSYLSLEKPVIVSFRKADIGMVEATVANTRAGSVKARRRAELAPAIGGRIATLNANKGDMVKAGQLLISLWNKDLRAELDLAREQSIVAEATESEICLMAQYAQRQAERLTELRKNRSTSESSYDEAVATAASKQAACRAAKAQRGVSLARINAATAMVERTIITAPFDGIVAEVNGEIGEYITPSPPGIATLPVVDLINMDSLYVAAPIDEIDAAQIRPGMETRITLDAFPKRVFQGRTRSISPYVLEQAKQARTVEIEVDFADPMEDAKLLVGYSADVEIIIDSRSQVVRIPTESLLEDGHVYILQAADNRLEYRKVTTGLSNWKLTEVREGLVRDERVVTTIDRDGLADGAAAEIDTTTGREKEK